MSSVAVTVERQAPPGRRSAHLVRSPGHRSGVLGLQRRRCDWLLRISDLLGELEAAMGEIDALTGEIEERRDG